MISMRKSSEQRGLTLNLLTEGTRWRTHLFGHEGDLEGAKRVKRLADVFATIFASNAVSTQSDDHLGQLLFRHPAILPQDVAFFERYRHRRSIFTALAAYLRHSAYSTRQCHRLFDNLDILVGGAQLHLKRKLTKSTTS